MNDKRNPSLIRGDGEILRPYLDRLREHISQLEWQSDGHRMWYTHKNPYSCWICQILQVCNILHDELMALTRTDGTDAYENGREPIDLNKSKST